MSIDIRDRGDHSAAADSAFAELQTADHRFSSHIPGSELSRVNRYGEAACDLSDDFREVMDIGARAAEASHGAFRVRRHDGSFDLDGVVKGWAAARAARALRDSGVDNFCVNAGGDIVTGGDRGTGPWRIGVRSPSDPSAVFATIEVTDAAVATSGAYERGEHIVDGRTGETARELISATVVAGDLTDADVLATSVFALGIEGVAWALTRGARAVIAVDRAGRVLTAGHPSAAGDVTRAGRVAPVE